MLGPILFGLYTSSERESGCNLLTLSQIVMMIAMIIMEYIYVHFMRVCLNNISRNQTYSLCLTLCLSLCLG